MFEDSLAEPPRKTSTVLVVDDQATSRAILEQVARGLEPFVTVETFARAVDAVVWTTRHPADLVLVDYLMPDMDGIRFINCLRALPGYEQVPIIMVTVSEEREVRYAALDAGATDFLTKPVDARECLARCRNLLTLRRQQLTLEAQTARLEETMRELKHEARQHERGLEILPAHVARFRPRKHSLGLTG